MHRPRVARFGVRAPRHAAAQPGALATLPIPPGPQLLHECVRVPAGPRDDPFVGHERARREPALYADRADVRAGARPDADTVHRVRRAVVALEPDDPVRRRRRPRRVVPPRAVRVHRRVRDDRAPVRERDPDVVGSVLDAANTHRLAHDHTRADRTIAQQLIQRAPTQAPRRAGRLPFNGSITQFQRHERHPSCARLDELARRHHPFERLGARGTDELPAHLHARERLLLDQRHPHAQPREQHRCAAPRRTRTDDHRRLHSPSSSVTVNRCANSDQSYEGFTHPARPASASASRRVNPARTLTRASCRMISG
jgi:hypothetical protein